jgi:LysR family transcriptional regulator, transcriptional activator for dmlA
MTPDIQPADFGFFSALVAGGSLSAAARELGITTSAVSRRLTQMEERLGVALVIRTTRRMGVTPEGEVYLAHARRVLGEIESLQQLLGRSRAVPTGLLRVNATLGFGRHEVAPIISRFVREHPRLDVQLQLSANPPLLTDDTFDVCVRFGEPPDSRMISRLIAPNRRLLCAAPSYLAQRGMPKAPGDLGVHNFIGIRQGDEGHGLLRLGSGSGRRRHVEVVKVRGNLVTNDGEIAVNWALEGHGILMRAEWDIAHYLKSGKLVQVLPNYDTPDADIFAVYPQRHQHSVRVRAFVDFLAAALVR